MPDWNKDGKTDWHDDFVFNNIINNNNTSSRQSSYSSIGSDFITALGSLMKIFGVVFMLLFGFLCLYGGLWLASVLSDIFL